MFSSSFFFSFHFNPLAKADDVGGATGEKK
jgi:hypothetical protein